MEPDIRYWLDQGKEFFKNQTYRRAETFFLKIIANKHEFADVYNMLGIIYSQTGKHNDAISSFQRALKINPHYTEAMLNLSVLLNDLGEYKQAKQILNNFKKETKKGKKDVDPFIKGKLANKHAEVGDMYRGLGLFAQASEEFQKALELAPRFHDIRNKLGISYREDGKKQQALKEFSKIVKEKPGYVDAQIQLGITLLSLNNKNEARKVWGKLAKRFPNHQLVKTYLRLSKDQKKRSKRKK